MAERRRPDPDPNPNADSPLLIAMRIIGGDVTWPDVIKEVKKVGEQVINNIAVFCDLPPVKEALNPKPESKIPNLEPAPRFFGGAARDGAPAIPAPELTGQEAVPSGGGWSKCLHC